jgi:phosphate uptake regulator
MKRKLIQHGLSSLTVSLPSKWIKENNLKKGNEIDLTINNNNNINISTEKHYEHKKISIDVSRAQAMIRKLIGAAFKSGYDEIEIKFESFEELKLIQEVMREQFTGFEVINQSKNFIIIKNVNQTNFEEFNNVLRRLFFVLNQIATETYEASEKNDFNWLKNITLLKIESDKYADYCRRAINVGFDSEFKKLSPLYTIIEQLEKTVDRYKDLCEYSSTYKIKNNVEIINALKELSEFQKQFQEIFYKFETKKMSDFTKKKELVQTKINNLYNTSSKKDIKLISLLDRILNLIYDLNGPMMAVYF